MKCGYCQEGFFPKYQKHDVESAPNDSETHCDLETTWCPICGGLTVILITYSQDPSDYHDDYDPRRRIYPLRSSRKPPPPEVNDERLAQDFREACAVLPLSPQASAALSRRCMQHIIREKAGIAKDTLFDEIEELIASPALPSYIRANLHAVRKIGNVAAHPMKNATTGEILPVDEVEAEWNLDVIESLLDFYYVQPARSEALLEAHKAKMESTRKAKSKV